MSQEAPLTEQAGCSHAVQFYEDDRVICDAVAQFVMDGLRGEDSVIVIASGAHEAAIQRRVRQSGVDLDEAAANGAVAFIDARGLLNEFMVGALPDGLRFRAAMDRILGSRGTGAGRLRLYGSMVDLLCSDGNPEGALLLEDLWNELARSHEFTLLCAYAVHNLYREINGTIYQQICERHTHVLRAS